jgi:4-hydroxybenzoate polyprenyltransferase
MYLQIQVLARFTRIRAYLPTLFTIIPLIFLISPQNLLSFTTAVIFLANLFLTAFIYAYNDVEDAADDYNILEKRRRNPIANGNLSKTQGYIISLFLLLIGLSLLATISTLVFLLGIALGLVGFFYSWKPVRFKSMPFIDIISHVICLGALQFLITYLAFRPVDVFVIPFLMIILPFSLMVEVLYELRDFNVDRDTNIRNTIQRLGKINMKKLLIVSCATALIGFTLIFLTIQSEYGILIILGSIVVGIALVSKVNNFLTQTNAGTIGNPN